MVNSKLLAVLYLGYRLRGVNFSILKTHEIYPWLFETGHQVDDQVYKSLQLQENKTLRSKQTFNLFPIFLSLQYQCFTAIWVLKGRIL